MVIPISAPNLHHKVVENAGNRRVIYSSPEFLEGKAGQKYYIKEIGIVLIV